MKLTEVTPNPGARKRSKRVGRGTGSCDGKTCCRGNNGQGQRSGESTRFGFEGGQTPLFRRLPKIHNFDQIPGRSWVAVNVGSLAGLAGGSDVTLETLANANVLRKTVGSLRILGNGELKIALNVKAHHVTSGAKTKIEAAGGTVTIIS